ncbi:hypothetical protein GTU79_03455 [Sodalis ligni]|uniref:hypothetical protein n=1 Tax=Sodalis ligni TaxID=2697027 RepID=UPI001BDEEDA5|nr:hypothetical protein [Sodalis ligni]QWA11867.1 hypothetical protein GTU79_03455 [Sodalis ligni]
MTKADLNQVFERVCFAGLEKANVEDIKTIAISLWHQNELPDTSLLKTNEARKTGGFILDRLCRFNCVPYNFKNEVLAIAESLYKKLSMPEADSTEKTPLDKLAAKWGLDSDLCKFMGDILPFQTRHAFGCRSFA